MPSGSIWNYHQSHFWLGVGEEKEKVIILRCRGVQDRPL